MKITGVLGREILDSRGNPTVEVDVATEISFGSGAAPSGASTGKHEAVELRDGGKRYLGKGVRKAVENVNTIIGPAIVGMDVKDQERIDRMMIELDGTKNKSKLGANAIIATSIATSKAAATSQGLPLYKYLNDLYTSKYYTQFRELSLPRAMFNIINGGKHAGGKLAIQEFMIVPSASTFSERLQMASEIYHVLGKRLVDKYGISAKNVGDEGGYVPQIENTADALEELTKAVEECGYGGECKLAIDAAADSFYNEVSEKYSIDGHQLSRDELIDYYVEMIDTYSDLFSIEDPFYEEDFESFAKLLAKVKSKGAQIVGDDLVVTNPERIQMAIERKSINAIILKVNQIGTITEALEALELARKGGCRIIVSHRSGETEDPFIADFSVGVHSEFIKSGAPARGERTVKYNQLLRIEEHISFMEAVKQSS